MVNVLDMPSRGFGQTKVWEEAFRVTKLFFTIEPETCEVHSQDVLHLNCFSCQQRFKELAYRIFEELCEAADASSKDHVKEEIADAAIFANALFRLVGYEFKIKWGGYSYDIRYHYDPIIKIGLMTNCLKLRPWRRQYSEVDECHLYKEMENVIRGFNQILTFSFENEEDFLDFVDRKVQVNEFRFNSKY